MGVEEVLAQVPILVSRLAPASTCRALLLLPRPSDAQRPAPHPRESPPDASVFSVLGFLVACFLVYHTLSDGDFSFLLTLGSLLNLFGFGLLLIKLAVTRKATNISLKTLQAYALVFSFRLVSILFYEGYLPFDRSGDWFYQGVEIAALTTVVVLIAVIVGHREIAKSYARQLDKFGAIEGRIPAAWGVVVLAVPALLLAIVLHPSLNGNVFTDVAWTFALYLEAVAIIPQTYLFYSPNNPAELEPFEINFVFSLAVSRLLHFIFWLSSYQELNEKGSFFLRRFPGHLVVLSQVRRRCARVLACARGSTRDSRSPPAPPPLSSA